MRYVILPIDGIRISDSTSPSRYAAALLRALKPRSLHRISPSAKGVPFTEIRGPKAGLRLPSSGLHLRVIASLGSDGPKLVEASAETAAALRQRHPGIRVVEEQFCRPAISPRPILPPRPARLVQVTSPTVRPLVVRVVRDDTGAPVPSADIYVFRTATDALEGRTNRSGEASFPFGVAVKKLEQILVYHEQPGIWGGFHHNVAVRGGVVTIRLAPIDLSAADSFRHFHGAGPGRAGSGVRVGVIDAGAATDHPDLAAAIEGGANCVPGSRREIDDFGPAGAHGTHVAGLIAGGGSPPSGLRGAAPAVKLRIYRVFEDGNVGSGSSFAVIDAIERAIADRCDLINLSLGLGPGQTDEGIASALHKARQHGILPIAAAGNDGRQDVTFPASDAVCVAVSAAGHKELFPSSATEVRDIAAPYGTDRKHFLGAFSNTGRALDATGSGVGVISTFPKGHGAMSGTSMASPAIAGVAARLLSARPAILKLPRNAKRSDAVRKMLIDAAKPLGFGRLFEGAGVVR